MTAQPPRIARRSFLAATSLGAVALAQKGVAQPPATPAPGFIVRQQAPLNLESPLSALESFVTPTEQFFVRSHSAVPQLTAATWTLEVGGAVERPFRINYQELLRLPARTQSITFECAGNNRVSLTPRERGLLWGPGAVGNAEWTGVSLATLLERAGPQNRAVDVVLEGADEATANEEPRTPGAIRFARSLPIAKARQGDVTLAYRMNGRDLTAAHGFPVRAVVPGWYGVASVKWLTRITVLEQTFQGYYHTLEYSYWDRTGVAPVLRSVGEMDVKATILRPTIEEAIPSGQPYLIQGVAWTGDATVARVEVSVDGGTNWAMARLLGDAVPNAWRRWEFSWQNPQPGRTAIMARATDSRGRVQPLTRQLDNRNCMISYVLPVDVVVR